MFPAVHQLAAFMFTDIVGYTALMGKDEQKMTLVLYNKSFECQKLTLHLSNNNCWLTEGFCIREKVLLS